MDDVACPNVEWAEMFTLGTEIQVKERRVEARNYQTIKGYFGERWRIHPERVHVEPVEGKPDVVVVYMLSDHS